MHCYDVVTDQYESLLVPQGGTKAITADIKHFGIDEAVIDSVSKYLLLLNLLVLKLAII